MKKFLICAMALFAVAACSDESDATLMNENPGITNGVMTGENMNFYGVSRSTSPEGEIFTCEGAHFEFTRSTDNTLTLYMHATQFAAAMPGIEMRLTGLEYSGEGKVLEIEAESVVPEANLTGEYVPYERFAISDFDGIIENLLCRVEFECMGYNVVFDGRLVLEVK